MIINKSNRIIKYFITIVFCLLIIFTKNIQAQNVYIEADQYINTNGNPAFAPWIIVEEGSGATGKRYITYTNMKHVDNYKHSWDGDDKIGGQAHYSFNIDALCNIRIWGRVHCPTPEDDSFSIKILELDDCNWDRINNVDGAEEGFEWVNLAAFGFKTYSNVSPGIYTLIIQPRENFTKIDAFFISTDGKKPDRNYSGKLPSKKPAKIKK